MEFITIENTGFIPQPQCVSDLVRVNGIKRKGILCKTTIPFLKFFENLAFLTVQGG